MLMGKFRGHDEWWGFCFFYCLSSIHIFYLITSHASWWSEEPSNGSAQFKTIQPVQILLVFFPLSFPSCALRGMWTTQAQAPFLRWNASRCEQIHQCVSPTEILRWWMDLMDWFKPQLPFLTDWITEWMLQQITSAAGERIYSVHFLHSWVHPSLMADCWILLSRLLCVLSNFLIMVGK